MQNIVLGFGFKNFQIRVRVPGSGSNPKPVRRCIRAPKNHCVEGTVKKLKYMNLIFVCWFGKFQLFQSSNILEKIADQREEYRSLQGQQLKKFNFNFFVL